MERAFAPRRQPGRAGATDAATVPRQGRPLESPLREAGPSPAAQPAAGTAPQEHHGVVPAIVGEVLRGPGAPLAGGLRQAMEPGFGQDFSHVRVHTDSRAAESARAVGAWAYAAGSHVVLDPVRQAPGTPEHSALLAHELAHVAQQRSAMPVDARRLRFSTDSEEAQAERAGRAVAEGRSAPAVGSAPFSIARSGGPKSPPKVIPTGQRAIIQWGDDAATVANVEALRTGLRSGPNAAGANTVVHYQDLVENSLGNVRELEIVIHGEPIAAPEGGRFIRPGETAPRADVGVAGLPKGAAGPAVTVTPEEMARKVVAAGFGQGRWTRYRIRLVMCFGGVGEAESYATRLSASMASRNVATEAVGYTGRVSATGRGYTELVPPGQGKPRPAARPQPGIPQPEAHYSEPGAPAYPFRRPGTGVQRVLVPPQPKPGPASPPPGAAEPAGPAAEPGAPAKPPTAAAEPAGTPAKPPTTAAEPAAGPAKPGGTGPGAVPRRGMAGRVAVGAVKFLGPMILDAVTAHFVAKHEEKKIAALITSTLRSAAVEGRINGLVEQQHMDVAYKQWRGGQVFATIEMRLYLTNEVLDRMELARISLTDKDLTESMSVLMSHDAIVGAAHYTRYETVSVPLPAIEVTESEALRLQIRALDEPGDAAKAADPTAAQARSRERARLAEDLGRAEQEEERARTEEIARPRVLADDKERAKQQADILERMRKLREQSPPTPPGPRQPPQPQAAPAPLQAGPPSLVPAPAPGPSPLLPGAGGETPVQQAARAVEQAKAVTEALYRRGVALRNRLATEQRPTDAERQAFFTEVAQWQLAIKASMNQFRNQGREEAVNALGELIDRFEPKLREVRTHLGG